MLRPFSNDPKPRKSFLVLFAGVFLLVFGSCAGFAFFSPEEYASSAVIKVVPDDSEATFEDYRRNPAGDYDSIQKELGLIRSESFLDRVAKKLKSEEARRNAASGAAAGSEADTIELLKQKVELRPVPNTTLVEVWAHSKSPWEACDVANEMARAYLDSRRRDPVKGMRSLEMVGMVDVAVPGLKPVRPNKPLILTMGIFGGALLALVVAGAGTLLSMKARVKRAAPPRHSGAAM